MITKRSMHSNMAYARVMVMHMAEPKSPCQSFVRSLTTKLIHKNCGSGSIPLNVSRCRIPALFPADSTLFLFPSPTVRLGSKANLSRSGDCIAKCSLGGSSCQRMTPNGRQTGHGLRNRAPLVAITFPYRHDGTRGLQASPASAATPTRTWIVDPAGP